MAERLKPFKTRWTALKNELSKWTGGWQDISDYIVPTRGFFDGEPNDGATINHKRIIDDGPGRALRTLGAGLASGLTSPSRPWFRLKLQDEKLNNSKGVKLWLDEVSKVIYSIFQKSNFYPAFHSGYEEIGAFGTSADLILEDFKDVIRVRSYTAGEYMIGVGADGRVNTFGRMIRMTVGQMVQEFGKENVSLKVQQQFAKNNTEVYHKVNHLIEPNDERVPDMHDNLNMPFRSVYWEEESKDNDKFLRQSGFEEFPALCPRWGTKSSGDVYSRGPGHLALGDSKMLQRLHRDSLLAVAKVNDPPVQKDANVQGDVNTLPGGVTSSSSVTPDAGVRIAYQIRPDLQAINEKIDRTQRGLDATFFADMFLALSLRSKSNMTAREVAEVHEEKLLLLGPVIERLQSDKLGPAIERTFAIADRAGMIPELPPELEGQEVEIEYISILAQAQKIVGVGAIRDHVAWNQEVAEKGNPEIMDNVDLDEASQAHGDLMGVPAAMVRSPEDRDAIRKARADAAAIQAQQEQAAQLVEGAKTASEAKLKDGSSMLDKIDEAAPEGAAV